MPHETVPFAVKWWNILKHIRMTIRNPSESQTYPVPADCEVVINGTIALPDGSRLVDLQVHRVLPGRRWVFSASWQGQPVFAKLFIGKQAHKYAARDASGAKAMERAGLNTPGLLWQGHLQDPQTEILIYAAIPQAENVEQRYEACDDDEQRLALIQRVVQMLAQQHAADLVQTDLHLKNFMVASDIIWAIDGDGIRKKKLSRLACYRQLARLISKLSIFDQLAWTGKLLAAYQQQRQWSEKVPASQILAWAKKYKAEDVREYVERKIFRNCTDVAWQETSTFVLARNASAVLPVLTPALLEAAMQNGEVLKPGNSSTVVRTHLAQWDAVIKRYNIKHIWHALSRCWRPSRAAISWSNAHRLQYYGFLTPTPLAMLEKRTWGLRREAYFISEASLSPDAIQFFNTVNDKSLRQEAMRQLALTCYQFYLLKIGHGDLKATNLQVNAQGKIIIMDLDSMQQYRCARRALRAHAKDIRRLLQNWKHDTYLYNALVNSFRTVYADAAPLKLAGISINQ